MVDDCHINNKGKDEKKKKHSKNKIFACDIWHAQSNAM